MRMRSWLWVTTALVYAAGALGADLTFGTVRMGTARPAPLVWQERGNGIWHVLKDGNLTGARDVVNSGPKKKFIADEKDFRNWLNQQAWIYTTDEYGDCDIVF